MIDTANRGWFFTTEGMARDVRGMYLERLHTSSRALTASPST